jgi:hypothetical protein
MNYVPKSPRKIKTNRYLFHVSHPTNREGIQNYGLFVNEKDYSVIPNGVYAHNLLTQPDYNWYPFVMFGDYDSGCINDNDPLKLYDFWRIDTQKIENDWFIDYAARYDFGPEMGYDPKDMYVYTDKDVSIRALQLFRLQNDQFWEFEGIKGAVHYRGIGEFRPYIEF